jgi:hypothetical protein
MPGDAIEAVRRLAQRNLAIIGGDIWIMGPRRPVHTKAYSGWHTNRDPDESWDLFVQRASNFAISRIPRLTSDEPGSFVVLVVSDNIRQTRGSNQEA